MMQHVQHLQQLQQLQLLQLLQLEIDGKSTENLAKAREIKGKSRGIGGNQPKIDPIRTRVCMHMLQCPARRTRVSMHMLQWPTRIWVGGFDALRTI